MQKLFTCLFNTTSISRVNASEVLNGNAGPNKLDGLTIMNDYNGGAALDSTQELILYNSDETANFTPIEESLNTAFEVYTPLLLDTYPAFAAYDVAFQLKTGQTQMIEVREDSGGTYEWIGPAAGVLDETALLAHTLTNNGFVRTTKDAQNTANTNDAVLC